MYNGYLCITSDHGGYHLKNRLIRYFKNELKVECEDLGPFEFDAEDDFPDFIIPAAKKAVKQAGRAILICGSGIGACLAANKVSGMRAALGYNIEVAELSIKHNNANGLCLAGRVLTEEHAMAIVKKWLETEEFLGGKYQRRNEKIIEEETRNKFQDTKK
jgi:ribose 5-phosphate isomerase B